MKTSHAAILTTVGLVGAEVVVAGVFLLAPIRPAVAYANPDTVSLSDIDVDQFPQCAEEDCSDQPGQVGMWLDRDTGNWYLELGEPGPVFLVVDDTVTGGVR